MKCALRSRVPFTLGAISVLSVFASSRASAQAFRTGFEAPGTSGSVYALCVFDDGTGSKLFAAGDFEAAGAAVAGHVARWNFATQSWSSLGAGIDGRVGAMVV